MTRLTVSTADQTYVEYFPELFNKNYLFNYVRKHYGTECLWNSEQVDRKDIVKGE